MTDLELLDAFLEQSGLNAKDRWKSGAPDRPAVERKVGAGERGERIFCVRVWEGEGYVDFYVEFRFDEEGKFVSHGVWE